MEGLTRMSVQGGPQSVHQRSLTDSCQCGLGPMALCRPWELDACSSWYMNIKLHCPAGRSPGHSHGQVKFAPGQRIAEHSLAGYDRQVRTWGVAGKQIQHMW
jgi:hypothetical protein